MRLGVRDPAAGEWVTRESGTGVVYALDVADERSVEEFALAPLMNRGGRIVDVSSGAGFFGETGGGFFRDRHPIP